MVEKKCPAIPVRGIAKSGRRWKEVQTKRSSAKKKGPAFNTSWEKKISLRKEKQIMKAYQARVDESRKKEKAKERKRIEKRRRQKQENEKKSEVVQVISNLGKLKRMKKKHRRLIEKRDTSGVKTTKML